MCPRMSNQILHAFPRAGRENSGVFAGVKLPFVPDCARVQDVGQQSPQRIQGKRAARAELTRLEGPAFEPPAPQLDLRQRSASSSFTTSRPPAGSTS